VQGGAHDRVDVADGPQRERLVSSAASLQLDAEDPDLSAARAGAFGLLLDEIVAARATGWGKRHSELALALTCWSTVHGAVTLWREGTLETFFPGVGGVQAVARIVTETLNTGLAAEADAPGSVGGEADDEGEGSA
jgi:hypothetical protein